MDSMSFNEIIGLCATHPTRLTHIILCSFAGRLRETLIAATVKLMLQFKMKMIDSKPRGGQLHDPHPHSNR